MIYYFAYEGKVYQTHLHVVFDGYGKAQLNCISLPERHFVCVRANAVMDGKCKFHEVYRLAEAEAKRQDPMLWVD